MLIREFIQRVTRSLETLFSAVSVLRKAYNKLGTYLVIITQSERAAYMHQKSVFNDLFR